VLATAVCVGRLVAVIIGVSVIKRNPLRAAAVATALSTIEPLGNVTAVLVAVRVREAKRTPCSASVVATAGSSVAFSSTTKGVFVVVPVTVAVAVAVLVAVPVVVADTYRIPCCAEVVATMGSSAEPYGTTTAVLVTVLVLVAVPVLVMVGVRDTVAETTITPFWAAIVAISAEMMPPWGIT